eukprot:CAMPEP_0198215490 /NCGR_PEP_ID=MMETSP1445-20131203/50233_1 /TAXON_ID=36898 /ORGANISM="Pyramimonas sp., Strain CCMP2087" /LENGTH=242 /DNA_ID=CAMNT_0043891241 /DNA_START=87 /DNA_END=812 /DNA_ORIENTATION=-
MHPSGVAQPKASMLYARALTSYVSGGNAAPAPRIGDVPYYRRPRERGSIKMNIAGVRKPLALLGHSWREPSTNLKAQSDFFGCSIRPSIRSSAVRGIHSASGPMVCEAKLKAGKLVEYGKSGSDKQLGLIERADGKTNWMIVNRYGKLSSVSPKVMSYVLPGDGFKPTDVAATEESAAGLSDASLLADGWEILTMEQQKSVEVADLAQLLFSSSDTVHCYATHCMLTQDVAYFKKSKKDDSW